MMTSRERLTALMQGKDYDRPPLNFYEVTGYEQKNPSDPFNIFNDPSWDPLIKLAHDKSDSILLCGANPIIHQEATNKKSIYTENYETEYDENGSRFVTYTLTVDGRTLTRRTRQDRDVNTIWTLEHLLKDADDLEAWMKIPEAQVDGYDPGPLEYADNKVLGDGGIALVDSSDAFGYVAGQFSFEDSLVMALTETELFKAAMDKVQTSIVNRAKGISKVAPGRMWRICGPEYAGAPYLPKELFDELVGKYDKELMDAIREGGGYPRLHMHGNIKRDLDTLVEMGAWGTDPIEPPGQGDVTLGYVKEKYGDKLALFGNLEVSDIETLTPDEFAVKVETALDEGDSFRGKGFVLQLSGCPIGRKLSKKTLDNYYRLIEVVRERYPGTI